MFAKIKMRIAVKKVYVVVVLLLRSVIVKTFARGLVRQWQRVTFI